MAKYGTGLYNSGFKYGQSSAVSVYYNANIAAWSNDYQTVDLTWGGITSDPTDNPPTHWMLIKSYTGTPDTPYDGELLAGGTFASFINSYTDTNATVGKEVNYSIWVFNGLKWIFCGSDYAVVVDYSNTLIQVLNWFPKAWLNPVNSVGDAIGEYEDNTLVLKLKAFSFVYDKLRTEASILGLSNDHTYTPVSILRKKVTDYGFNYESALGDTYFRSMSGAGNVVNSYKGTSLGIGIYTTALTHWANHIEVGHNDLLDYNDSSFEESIGRWTTDLGTLTQQTYSSPLDAPVPHLYDTLFPPRNSGYASLVITGKTTPTAATLSLPSVSNNIINYAAPVVAGTRYVFSGYVKHSGTRAATIAATIRWYDAYGSFISATSAPTAITTTTSWQEFTSISDGGRNGKVAPTKAAYAVLQLSALPTTTSTTTVFFDMFQLAIADKSIEFEDARRVRVYVKGEQENLLPNPSFEQGVGGWTASPNGSFAQDPTIYNAAVWHGTCVGELTIQSAPASGQYNGYISSDWFVVEPGQNYTFSAYLSTEYPTFGRAFARIEFSNRESIDKQVYTLHDADGYYYDNTVNYVDSDPVTLTAHTVINPDTGLPWIDAFVPGTPVQYVPTQERISVSAIAPAYSRDSGQPMAKVSIYYPDCTPGQTTWIDGALFENAAELQSFFDGDGAPMPTDPVNDIFYNTQECTWEYKNIINYLENPSFELVSGSTVLNWTAGSGTALTRDAGPGASSERPSNNDGTYQNIIVPTTYTPLYGTYMGKVAYDSAVGGSISTTVYLPSPAVGGEDFVVSAWVRAAEGVYTISTSGSSVTSTNSMEVYQHDQYQWIRVHCVRQLVPGETSFTATIAIAPPPPFFPGGGAGYTIGPTNFFHIDSAQAEYGRIPNTFVNPAATTTTPLSNPGHPASTMYAAQIQSKHGGKSNHFFNYTAKLARLTSTLNLIMPTGSTWCIKPGMYTEDYPDLSESLIPSASFEKNLGSWASVNSTLARVISRGSLFGDHVSHGAAYCLVTTSGTNNSTKTFGITTAKIPVLPNGGYYGSVALRPANANSLGTYTLEVDFYDAYDNPIVVYLDNITGYLTTAAYDRDHVANAAVTSTARIKTFEVTHTDRWAYLANIFPLNTIIGASYAIFKVTYTPASFVAGQAFHIDRCVFRQ